MDLAPIESALPVAVSTDVVSVVDLSAGSLDIELSGGARLLSLRPSLF